MKPVYLILIDALRHDYLCPEHTPNLYALKERSMHANVVETFAFQTRPAYFAGLEPEESGVCHLFRYAPEESPFSFLKPFRFLLRFLEKLKLDLFVRGVIRRLAARKLRKCGYEAGAEAISTERIPLTLLPFFTLAELVHTDDIDPYNGKETLFRAMRERGLSWEWIGYPRHHGNSENILQRLKAARETDLYYLHFSELDWVGHKYGPDGAEMKKALSSLDKMLGPILREAFEDKGAAVVVFGDHGMAQVQFTLDLEARLTHLPYENGKQYLMFLDSTQARFWFFDEQAEERICSLLSEISEGHILSEEERAELRIRFKDRSYGDLIFMLDEPGIIHPSYFVRSGAGPKGMHGYLPKVTENMTQILAAAPKIDPEDIGTIPMREMYPFIKNILDL